MTLVLATLLVPADAVANDIFMSVGPRTNQPIGHHDFCLEQMDECRPDSAGRADPLQLSPPLILKVAKINTAVNAAIEPASDWALYNAEERWAYPSKAGDCEDYVLLKRRRLMEAGIAAGNLLITVVRKRNGEGHAVLTLRTSEGDFILDNLDWRVRPWFDTPYRFVKRQSSAHPGRWVSIETNEDVPVASLTR